MNRSVAPPALHRPGGPYRLSRLALALVACTTLGACSSLGGLFSDDTLDYRSGAVKTRQLDVPPDLSQLARDSRYRVEGGVVSASGMAAGPTVASASTTATASVAIASSEIARVRRDGQQRWLEVALPPEQVWPRLRGFWEQSGFTLEVDDAATGILETNWAENRAKLPQDVIRRTLGRIIGGLYDTGERDRFRTRVERTATGSEVYVSHRGAHEVYTDASKESTAWKVRPSDPELEAEMLSRLLVALSGRTEPAARQAVMQAATQAVTQAPALPSRARLLPGRAALEVDESFDRAWRRVGLALDRGGFTVEDRDRAAGIYYVRWIDPKFAGQEEPGFWARLTGKAESMAPVRYRIALNSLDNKTTVSVLTSAGAAEVGDNGQRIAAQLANELR